MNAHAYTADDLDRAARALGDPHKAGAGWSCRCPCHDDDKASLTLDLGEGGKLLWRCHAGSDGADSPRSKPAKRRGREP